MGRQFMPLWRVTFVVFLFAAISSVLAAEIKPKYVSPPSLPGSVRVSAEQIIKLVGTVDELVMIDSRTTNDREMGYIEGSLGMTDTNTNCDQLAKVLLKPESPVLFYCNGINCARSDNAVKIARQCGYTKIYWFRGGIEEWREKKLPLVQ